MLQSGGNLSQYVLHSRDNGPVGVGFREEGCTLSGTKASVEDSTVGSHKIISNVRAGRYQQRGGMGRERSDGKGKSGRGDRFLISKALSKILRRKGGATMQRDGFMPLQEVMLFPELRDLADTANYIYML